MSSSAYRTVGALFWLGVIVTVFVSGRLAWKSDDSTGKVSLARYLFRPADQLFASDPIGRLQVNDPIFYLQQDGEWKQIGYVMTTRAGDLGSEVTLAWYSETPTADQCDLLQFHSSGRLEEVVATMLPPEKQIRIQQTIGAAMAEHGDDLSDAFVPLVERTLRLSVPVIEEELKKSIASHRSEIDGFAARWNNEIVEEKLIPLAREEIVPIVRQHGQPTAEVIGRELWDQASLFRFGWRAVYDKTPLPRRDLVREEWERFVEQEAVPIFESHMDEIVVAVQRIVQDVAANEVVRSELADVAEQVAGDPETQRFVRTIMKETLLDNERLREVWSGVWKSDEAREALELAGDRLEPVVRQIGDELFGTQEEGINPDFARVLRSQILGKDRRWIVARPTRDSSKSTNGVQTIRLANEAMIYPIIHTVQSDTSGVGQ